MSQSPQKNIVKNNLLSNVSPPSELPSFFAAAVPPPQPLSAEAPKPQQPIVSMAPPVSSVASVSLDNSAQNVDPVPMYAVGSVTGAEQNIMVSFYLFNV